MHIYFSDEEFLRISVFLKSRYGIDMGNKKEIISGRLENYLHSNGFQSYTVFMNEVEHDITGQRERELVNQLTTNHTFFMREADHCDFLKSQVLPYLRRKEYRRKDLGIWCAAASTGQEPYTLAMVLVDFFGFEHGEWDTQILATDISTEALLKAAEGVYTKEQTDPLPENWKRRFLREKPGGELVEISKEIREQVIFRKFNLMDPFPFRRKMHVIFLRNVMIYFDRPTRRELIKKIYNVMEPGGYLFIGKTETLDKTDLPLEMIDSSIYRRAA